MNIGKLDRRVTLQQPTTTSDPTNGEEVNGWEDVDEVWAGRKFGTSQEAYDNDQKQATQRIAYRIRYREDILPTWRIQDKEQLFYLTGLPEELGRKNGLDLPTESRG